MNVRRRLLDSFVRQKFAFCRQFSKEMQKSRLLLGRHFLCQGGQEDGYYQSKDETDTESKHVLRFSLSGPNAAGNLPERLPRSGSSARRLPRVAMIARMQAARREHRSG